LIIYLRTVRLLLMEVIVTKKADQMASF
jgi:hypothetical protein